MFFCFIRDYAVYYNLLFASSIGFPTSFLFFCWYIVLREKFVYFLYNALFLLLSQQDIDRTKMRSVFIYGRYYLWQINRPYTVPKSLVLARFFVDKATHSDGTTNVVDVNDKITIYFAWHYYKSTEKSIKTNDKI